MPDSSSEQPAPGPRPLRFGWRELSGGLGDLGTFLPLAVGLAATCAMPLGAILVFAGLMHAASGLLFRQPIPIQPMKAIAAVAITQQLTPGTIAASGLLTGLAVTLLALSGSVERIARRIPRAAVRAIQLGVGSKLALQGVEWLFGVSVSLEGVHVESGLPLWAGDSLAVAAVAGALLALPRIGATILLPLVFVTGCLLVEAEAAPTLQPPAFPLMLPEVHEWGVGLWRGALPQLPLTLLNSVIAVCALSEDLFPGRGLGTRRVALSVGLMNLLCVPFGAMPMCHGSGGLAAQYRFGARTGGSVILLGALKAGVGLAFGASLTRALQAYPRSILAVMVILAGITLGKAARDMLGAWRSAAPVIVGAAGVVLVNTLGGFLFAMAVIGITAMAKRNYD